MLTKYQKIAQEIENEIKEYNTPHGTKLASIKQLSEQYMVSKNTILRALSILEEKGIIYQVQGSGIFVRQKTRTGYITLSQNQGFYKDLSYIGGNSQLISFDRIKAPTEVATNLYCKTNEEVYRVKRLHSLMDQPLCLEESYFKISIVPFLNESLVKESIFQYLTQALGIKIGFSDKYIRVNKTDEKLSNILRVPLESPVLSMEEIYYTTNGEPFDFSKNYYNYEHSQFFLQS